MYCHQHFLRSIMACDKASGGMHIDLHGKVANTPEDPALSLLVCGLEIQTNKTSSIVFFVCIYLFNRNIKTKIRKKDYK